MPRLSVWAPWDEVEPTKLRGGLTLQGYSVASLRTQWYLHPGFMVDAGLSPPFPANILCLTHEHADHIASLPSQFNGTEPVTVFCHANMVPLVRAFLHAHDNLVRGGTLIDAAIDAVSDASTYRHITFVGVVPGETPPQEIVWNKRRFRLSFFQPDHTALGVAYGLSEARHRRRSEFEGCTGAQMKALRDRGVEITETWWFDHVVFWGDTTHAAFANNPETRRFRTHVVECTFVHDDELDMAAQKKHMHWQNLAPIACAWDECQFVLTHFSQRYTQQDIRAWQRYQLADVPNVLVWDNSRKGSTEDTA